MYPVIVAPGRIRVHQLLALMDEDRRRRRLGQGPELLFAFPQRLRRLLQLPVVLLPLFLRLFSLGDIDESADDRGLALVLADTAPS